MTFLYQCTNVLNLPSIKQHGLAPLIKRPASIAQGATARDRAAKEPATVQSKIREYLYTCLCAGHSIEDIIACPGGQIELAPVKVTGEIDYSEPIPARIDLMKLDATTDAYLKDYLKLLGKPAFVGSESQLKAMLKKNKMESIVAFRNNYPSLPRAFLSVMAGHFITQLALRYASTYYDAEFKVTSENIYFFHEDDFSGGYDSYAKTIVSSVVANLAILRVDKAHCGEVLPDSAQGNAVTSKSVVPAVYISYVTNVPVAQVVSKKVFSEGAWSPLADYGS